MMRKVTFGGAVSLDNFIAREDHAVDWLLWGPETEELMTEFWKTIDTVLWGRKSYEATGGKVTDSKGVKNYVFSRTLGPKQGVEVVSGDAVEFVRELKSQSQSSKDI